MTADLVLLSGAWCGIAWGWSYLVIQIKRIVQEKFSELLDGVAIETR